VTDIAWEGPVVLAVADTVGVGARGKNQLGIREDVGCLRMMDSGAQGSTEVAAEACLDHVEEGVRPLQEDGGRSEDEHRHYVVASGCVGAATG
jgi:hypothetical protein